MPGLDWDELPASYSDVIYGNWDFGSNRMFAPEVVYTVAKWKESTSPWLGAPGEDAGDRRLVVRCTERVAGMTAGIGRDYVGDDGFFLFGRVWETTSSISWKLEPNGLHLMVSTHPKALGYAWAWAPRIDMVRAAMVSEPDELVDAVAEMAERLITVSEAAFSGHAQVESPKDRALNGYQRYIRQRLFP